MEYIKPLKIDYIETNVVDENFPPLNYPIWNSITTYTVGTKVVYNGKYYEATAENINQNPEEFNTTKTDLAVWSSPTVLNTKRCLDVTTNGRTTGTDEIYYKFPYRGYSTIAILQTKASTLEIKIFDINNNPLHTITDSFIEDFRTNYIKWEKGDYFFKDSMVIDMPFYPTGEYIEVRVIGEGEISIGFIVFGDRDFLGESQTDIGREIRALNPTFTDDLGNVNIQESPSVLEYVDVELFITPDRRREIITNLRRIQGQVAFFISTDIDEFNDLNLLGYFTENNDITHLGGYANTEITIKGYVNVNI